MYIIFIAGQSCKNYVIPCVLFHAPLVDVSLPLSEYLNSTSLGRAHAVLNEM